MTRILGILIFLFCFSCTFAKPIQCRIDIEVNGLENMNVILATEYGIKELVIDTVRLDSVGRGYFESKERIPGGIYIILLPNKKYFEFLVNDEQFFTIATDSADIIGMLKIEGADEPDLFRRYLQLTNLYNTLLKNPSKEDYTVLKIKQEELKKIIQSFKDSIYKNLPISFLAKYLKMQDEPLIPETRTNDKSAADFFKSKYNFKNRHYFDNIDLADNRLLHTRLIAEKINYYLNVFVSNDPDSICRAIDRIITLAKVNEEAYRFVLNILNINYRAARTPSQEYALVYLADNYYLNGKAPWADPRFIKLFETKVNEMRPALIGAQAPELVLQNIDNQEIKLKEIKANILILYFWSNDCNKCLEETPKLLSIYNKYKNKGLEILAIYTHADKQVWEDFIQKQQLDWVNAFDPLLKSNFSKLYNVKYTPKIYILDRNKKIIVKDISVERIDNIIERLVGKD
jgi:peroxiredoxin